MNYKSNILFSLQLKGRKRTKPLERISGSDGSMVNKERNLYTLWGKLLSPILLVNPFYKKKGCWIKIVGEQGTNQKPKRSFVGKLMTGERKAPTILFAYRGFVQVSCVTTSAAQAEKRINHFLAMDNLGSKANEGFGKVEWITYRVESYRKETAPRKWKKQRIRKGLGPTYPEELQKLLKAIMLHDFVHTERHPSKIYQEVTIENEEIREACRNHHNGEENENWLLPLVKYYDQLASRISRKKPYKTNYRYDHQNGVIDFEKITREIEERQQSAYKLYNYIYQSKELKRIVESMEYGKKSLRNHLLLMVNLAINSYYNKWLVVENEKIYMVRENSASVKESEEHQNTKDAEKHQSLTMSVKSSARKSIQINESRNTINKEKSSKKTMGYYTYSSSSPLNR
jgi:hypothetical protein